jgi:GNAT superfamily N-acetyltransferase
MHSIVVKRAAAQDAERLTALVHSSGAYRGRYRSIVAGYQVTPEYIDRHPVFMATGTAGNLLGFYSLLLDPPELDLMFVADEAQGRGVGRILVDHMLDRARESGVSGVRVVAHPDSEDFYLRMGAQRIGVVPPAPPVVTWERPELRFTLSSHRF